MNNCASHYNPVYKNRNITSELGIVIGAITQLQKLIDNALKSERKGQSFSLRLFSVVRFRQGTKHKKCQISETDRINLFLKSGIFNKINMTESQYNFQV